MSEVRFDDLCRIIIRQDFAFNGWISLFLGELPLEQTLHFDAIFVVCLDATYNTYSKKQSAFIWILEITNNTPFSREAGPTRLSYHLQDCSPTWTLFCTCRHSYMLRRAIGVDMLIFRSQFQRNQLL